MATKPKQKPVKVLNPRYAGATPEMVGRALMKHKPKDGAGKDKPSPAISDRSVRSSI